MKTFEVGEEVVVRVVGEGEDTLLSCLVCDRYPNKEGAIVLHLVEPQTQTQFRRFEAAFQKPEKKVELAVGGAN